MTLKTLRAEGRMNAGMTIEVECGQHTLYMDQPKGAGGQDKGPSPLEALLAAVAGCFGTIGRYVAHQQKITLHGMQFSLEADYDPDGLLGRRDDVRPGFQELRINVSIDADLDQAGKQAFLEEIERRCPVADNMTHGTRLISRLSN